MYGARRPVDERAALGREAEWAVARRLAMLGFGWSPTGHNARFDLLVEGCLRVEVKGSMWTSPGRYQACLHNVADVVIWGCRNGRWHWFVIPTSALGERRNVAVWSEDPARYGGRWAEYLEGWGILRPAVELARVERDYQLPLL